MIQTPSQDRLRYYFGRNGYMRFPDSKRQEEGYKQYKKGYEVRLVASDETELQEIRALLQAEGFKLANSYAKAKQWVQPIYGKAAVTRFREMVELNPTDEAKQL